jgi:hypothetical protein
MLTIDPLAQTLEAWLNTTALFRDIAELEAMAQPSQGQGEFEILTVPDPSTIPHPPTPQTDQQPDTLTPTSSSTIQNPPTQRTSHESETIGFLISTPYPSNSRVSATNLSLAQAGPSTGSSSQNYVINSAQTGQGPPDPFRYYNMFPVFDKAPTDRPSRKKRKTTKSKRAATAGEMQDASNKTIPKPCLEQAWAWASGWIDVSRKLNDWVTRDLPLRPFWMGLEEEERVVKQMLENFHPEFQIMSPPCE